MSADLTSRAEQAYDVNPEHAFYRPDPAIPNNMMVELSNACNHACIFCTNPHMQRKIGRINTDLLSKVMVEAYELGVREIGFYTTGDPFIHKDLEKFTREAAAIGYEYLYISTNGALATPDRAKAVIDAGMSSIKFSVNAGTRETYQLIHGRDDWDKVMEHIRFIAEYRKTLDRPLKLFATCVVTQQNAHETELLRAELQDVVDDIFFIDCGNQSGQMVAAETLLRPIEGLNNNPTGKGICPLPFNRLHLTCEGYLTMCCVDYQNYLAVADLNTHSLKDAWLSPDFVQMRQRHLDQKLEGTLCGNCWNNRCDAISPVLPKLAAEIDFAGLYNQQVDKVEAKLAVHAALS
jgi:molybdenum cofactor biosynthesis enzyme MoaA